jgi:hypothetical protein
VWELLGNFALRRIGTSTVLYREIPKKEIVKLNFTWGSFWVTRARRADAKMILKQRRVITFTKISTRLLASTSLLLVKHPIRGIYLRDLIFLTPYPINRPHIHSPIPAVCILYYYPAIGVNFFLTTLHCIL